MTEEKHKVEAETDDGTPVSVVVDAPEDVAGDNRDMESEAPKEVC